MSTGFARQFFLTDVLQRIKNITFVEEAVNLTFYLFLNLGPGSAPGHGLAFLMPLLVVLLLVIAIIVICLIMIKRIITRKVKDSKNSAGELESMNLLRGNGRSYGTDK